LQADEGLNSSEKVTPAAVRFTWTRKRNPVVRPTTCAPASMATSKDKDFWTKVIVFTAKDANLNKAHVRYLETRLVGIAVDANRYEIDNGSTLQARALSEADRADMERTANGRIEWKTAEGGTLKVLQERTVFP